MGQVVKEPTMVRPEGGGSAAGERVMLARGEPVPKGYECDDRLLVDEGELEDLNPTEEVTVAGRSYQVPAKRRRQAQADVAGDGDDGEGGGTEATAEDGGGEATGEAEGE